MRVGGATVGLATLLLTVLAPGMTAIAQERVPWQRDEAPIRGGYGSRPSSYQGQSGYQSQGDYQSQGTYQGQGTQGSYQGSGSARTSDAYRPPAPSAGPSAGYGAGSGGYESNDPYRARTDRGGLYGEPYAPPASAPYPPPSAQRYEPAYGGAPSPAPPRERDRYAADEEGDTRSFSRNEILDAGHRFFGSVSKGLADVVEYAFQRAGRPNGYILGEDAGGAVVAGLRYGEGVLYTRDAGTRKVYWQGPSIGYDFGAEGSKTMVLVYNLRDPSEIYDRFGGVQGSAYFVGGVGVQFQKSGDVTLAPIRSGLGLRIGANVGYLKYTPAPTWNPF